MKSIRFLLFAMVLNLAWFTLFSQSSPARSLKRKVAIARFTNESTYAKGIFFNKESNNPIEKQAADMLATKLAATEKFILMERQDFDQIVKEGQIGDVSFQKVGADFLIMGSVTEFGRTTSGESKFGKQTKTQTVRAGVSVRLVDVATSQIIYSEEAKGEAETKTKTVLGYGKEAEYDQALDDKAISAAISKLVENITNNCMNRPWKSFFLSADDGAYIISGGKSQGIMAGDQFTVMSRGKSVKNPQTGMMIELPGKVVGKIKVDMTGGETIDNEYSIVSFSEGKIDATQLGSYIITQQ